MRDMKDSGIEWIGKIPHCWNTSKLKYLGQYINGYAFKPEEWGSKGVPIIRIQDLTGSNDNPNYFEGQIDKKYWVENGDILISWAATLDAFIWNKGNGWLNQHIFKAVPNRRIIYYDFFFWMIKESMKNMNNDNKHGIFMQHVTLSVFNNFTIPMPPLAEQERIAAFLDAECAEIDAVLEKTRASIEEYKKLKQAVITQAVTKGIRGDRPMKDSGIEWIGDIPAEWSVVKGRRLILATQNGLTRRDLEKSEGFIVLKLKNLDADGNIDYSEVNRVALTDEEKSKYQLCDGDFLFVRVNGSRNLVGKCAIYHDVGEIVAYNDHIIRVKLNDLCLKEYFHYYLLSIAGKREIELHTSTAAGQFTISGDGLRELRVVLPGIVEQAETVAYLDKKSAGIDALIAKKQQYLTEIENYKKSLIYEYVTGKKEVV